MIRILNSAGSIVAKYEYDAWGKVLSVTNASGTVQTSSTFIGNINPIRYRGYYYDVETGFYYLQSRYYDPETGRFINADEPAMTIISSGTLLGKGLFTYCENNPVMHNDPHGYVVTPANVVGAVIGAIGGAVIGKAIANHFKLGWPWKQLVIGSTSAIITVVGWFAGPAVYAVIKPLVVKAISACTVVFTKAQEWVLRALGIAQKYINQALRLVNHNTIKFTKTVLNHLNNSARSVPIKTLIDCIKSGKAKPDAKGTKAIMYTITNFYKNGVKYKLEVLFDWATMTVLHFKYWR